MDTKKIIDVLYNIYQKCNDVEDLNLIVKELYGIKIDSIVNYYLYGIKNKSDDDSTIIELIIKICQFIYNNSGVESPLPDEVYDKLYEMYISDNDDIVGAINIKDRNIVNHKYPDLRGTLDKVHFLTIKEKGNDKRKSLENWLNSIENRIGRDLTTDELESFIFPKFDGLSIIFECDEHGNVERALTRGFTDMNEAVAINGIFSYFKFKPIEGWNSDFGIKTEVVMTFSNFKKICKELGEFKSPRSAVSSILNAKKPDPKLLKYLTVIPLRAQNFDTKEVIIHPDAFSVFPFKKINLKKYYDMFDDMNSIKEYVKTFMEIPVDGVVIHLTNKLMQEKLGREGAINKFEVAYKFKPESKKSILKDVEFSIGLLGNVSPVAKIEPVVINFNKIKSVSLGSIDRFETLGLRKGDEVIIKYDIIPYLDIDETCKRSDEEPIKVPTHCEFCGEELVVDPVLRCSNPDCPTVMIGKIVNYITKMNIPNISIGIVTVLFKEGLLRSIEDIYRLKDHKFEIINLDGFGEKSFNKIIKGIDSRREVFDYELLGSLGIPDIGLKIFKRISNIYYISEICQICVDCDIKKLMEIEGIKEKTAVKIVSGIIHNINTIKLLEKELRIKHDVKKYKGKVLFSKIRDSEFEKYLYDIDIQVLDNYNKSVDFVIVPDKNTSSTKIDKAVKDGKEILTIQEAYDVFGFKGK